MPNENLQLGLDRAERRSTIRESNEKIDKAINHLSDVMEHLKIVDDKRVLVEQINTLRLVIVWGMVLTWISLIIIFSLFFVHSRDSVKVFTQLEVMKLKVEETEKVNEQIRQQHKEMMKHR